MWNKASNPHPQPPTPEKYWKKANQKNKGALEKENNGKKL